MEVGAVKVEALDRDKLTVDDYQSYLEFEEEEDFGAWWWCSEKVDFSDPKVVEAMWTEINWFEFFSAFEVVFLKWALENGYWELTGTWVPTWDEFGHVKMRFVVREFKAGKKRDDLYTPASMSSTERYIDIYATKKQKKTFIIDCKNAYLHAEETDLVYP